MSYSPLLAVKRHSHEMEVGSEHEKRYDDQDVSIDFEHVPTLYVKRPDRDRTLLRRHRTSSRKRNSSKHRHKQEDLYDLLNNDENNHMLPTLLLRLRTKRKTLKERRHDLEEEKKGGDIPDTKNESSHDHRYQGMQEQGSFHASNFAELLRTSTMRKARQMLELTKPKKIEKISRASREFFSRFSLWRTFFKVIEGKFGTAVMSFFRFIRWLLFLNLLLMLIMLCVITLPFVAMEPHAFGSSVMVPQNSTFYDQALNCSMEYEAYNKELFTKESIFENILDTLQGTGWMERTVLFYGIYFNKTYTSGDGELGIYNMGLAYILAIGACFLISLSLLVNNSAKTIKTTFGTEQSVVAYTNRVLAGWDYAITSRKAVRVKQANLYSELETCLLEDSSRKKRYSRTSKEKCSILLTRVFVNLCILIMLGGSLYLVYFTTDKLLQLEERDLKSIVLLIVHFLPYLTITVLNFLLPIIFQKIVWLEDYSSTVALRITLARSIILRLASLGVLIGSLYRLLIINVAPEDGTCGNRIWSKTTKLTKGSIKCWETYVGQQIYKLVLLDLVVETGIIVLVHLPRRLGLFFSPLIPLITFVKCFIFFYLRKWTLLCNCSLTEQLYRTSGSHSLFMSVLLFSFILAAVPVGYMISSISPSQSCGPFRVYSSANSTMFSVVSSVVRQWPSVLRDVLLFVGSVAFFIPAMILLGLLIYYYWLLSEGYKRREKILTDQLKMISIDKRFLLTRVLMHSANQ